MNVLTENKMVKIWIDAHAPIIFYKLFQEPDEVSAFRQLSDQTINAITKILSRKGRVVYSLCDATGILPSGFERFVGHYLHYMPRQFKAGLSFKAIVSPKEILPRSVLQFNREMNHKAVVVYTCFENALEGINEKWSNISIL